MQIYGKEVIFYIKESNSHRISLEHQYGRRFIVLEHQLGRRFIVLEHQYGRRDVWFEYALYGEKLAPGLEPGGDSTITKRPVTWLGGHSSDKPTFCYFAQRQPKRCI